MPKSEPLDVRKFGNASVAVYSSPEEMGSAAAKQAALLIGQAIEKRGYARVIAATGNSQIPLANELVKQPVNWSAVDLFHMDEYINLSDSHPSSFRLWIRTRLVDKIHPRKAYYLNGDAPDLEAEIKRYTDLLLEDSIDLAFVGFGENGHIAFNDPPVANFNDPATVKRIVLDEACRRQQAGEGHFPSEEAVPRDAISITCPGLFRAESWVSCVPEARKATAVRNALEGPISEACPASLVRRHPNAFVYLDTESASLLSFARELKEV
jgi:glucosamine-6-phosphate deaminase